MLDFATNTSYRIIEKRINRIRLKNPKKGIKSRTICNIVDHEGNGIHKNIESQTETILLYNGFTIDGKPVLEEEYKSDKTTCVDEMEVNKVVLENDLIIDKKYKNTELYEKDAFNISVDDVCVKKQKEIRNVEKDPKSKKQIKDSVVHIEKNSNKMILNSTSIVKVLLFTLALVLNSGFNNKSTLVFFVDGERKLHNTIHSMFYWANYKIILDWAHIVKKCKEVLSMGLKNSKIRNDIIDELLPLIWYGRTEAAIEYVKPKNCVNFFKNQLYACNNN